jgi:hypothetical protein
MNHDEGCVPSQLTPYGIVPGYCSPEHLLRIWALAERKS